MKRSFLLFALVLALASIAKSQDGPRPFVWPPEARTSTNLSASIEESRDFERRSLNDLRVSVLGDLNAKPPSIQLRRDLRYAKFDAALTMSNETPKTVKQVTWVCSFIEPSTNILIASFVLVSQKRIAPHANSTIHEVVWIGVPAKSRAKVIEALQINLIREIKYTDGSVDTK